MLGWASAHGKARVITCVAEEWGTECVVEPRDEKAIRESFADLIDRVYEASLSPERLRMTVQAITDAVQADAGVFLAQDAQLPRLAVNVMASREDLGDAPVRLEQDFAFGDSGVLTAMPDRTQTLTPAQMEPWQSVLGPVAGAGVAVPIGDGALLALFRGEARPAFDDADCLTLQALLPALQQARRLLLRLAGLENQQALTTGLLDALSLPLLVLEGSGYLVFANTSARTLLDDAVGLRVGDDGRLGLDRGLVSAPRSHSRFAEMLAVTAQASLNGRAEAQAMVVVRPGGRPPLRLTMHSMEQRGPDLSGRKPLVAVHVSADQGLDPVDARILRGLFTLTPAEAALLQALMQDKRLEDYASERGVSVTTVRTQLAHLFRKTGTSRQAELVRLALAAAGAFR